MLNEYINVRIKRNSWKEINQEREPNETMDEVLSRVLSDRRKLKDMIMSMPTKRDLK